MERVPSLRSSFEVYSFCLHDVLLIIPKSTEDGTTRRKGLQMQRRKWICNLINLTIKTIRDEDTYENFTLNNRNQCQSYVSTYICQYEKLIYPT